METPQNSQQLLTLREFCTIYRTDKRTVKRRVRAGQLEGVWKPTQVGNKMPRLFIVDPGWQRAILAHNIKQGKDFAVDDVYILRGYHVAQILGVTPRAVRYMAQDGRLGWAKAGMRGNHHRRYSIADVRRLIAMREKGSYQKRRPTRKEMDAAVLKWARGRLGIPQPTTQ
jgi:hypothetical protein